MGVWARKNARPVFQPAEHPTSGSFLLRPQLSWDHQKQGEWVAWNIEIRYEVIQKWWYWYPPTISNMIVSSCRPASFWGHALRMWIILWNKINIVNVSWTSVTRRYLLIPAILLPPKHRSPIKPWFWNFRLMSSSWFSAGLSTLSGVSASSWGHDLLLLGNSINKLKSALLMNIKWILAYSWDMKDSPYPIPCSWSVSGCVPMAEVLIVKPTAHKYSCIDNAVQQAQMSVCIYIYMTLYDYALCMWMSI